MKQYILIALIFLCLSLTIWSEWKIRQPIIKKYWYEEFTYFPHIYEGVDSSFTIVELVPGVIGYTKRCTLYVYKKNENQ